VKFGMNILTLRLPGGKVRPGRAADPSSAAVMEE